MFNFAGYMYMYASSAQVQTCILSTCRCAYTHTHRKLTRNEHFELRDLKEVLSGGNYSKHHPQEAGMVKIPLEGGLVVTDLYYDFVQASICRTASYPGLLIFFCVFVMYKH